MKFASSCKQNRLQTARHSCSGGRMLNLNIEIEVSLGLLPIYNGTMRLLSLSLKLA
jgi:hypothetical protein